MATDEMTGVEGVVLLDDNSPTDGEEKKEVKMYGKFAENAYLQTTQRPFAAFGRTTRMDNAELSRMIFSMFRKTFHDLAGAIVEFNGKFQVSLFFEDNQDEFDPHKEFKNVVRIDKAKSKDTYDRMAALYNRGFSRKYSLNDETKLLLAPFMYGGRQVNKPESNRWNKNIVEIPVPMMGNAMYRSGDRCFIKVVNLDIHVILRHLFGDTMVIYTETDASGNETNFSTSARYEIRYMKPNFNGTFSMNIEQFDQSAVEKFIAKEYPQFNNYTGIQMYNV